MVGTVNYATDGYSTLGGLAAVAYGDSEYFREVKNQIHALSPTKTFDSNLPSSAISSLFGEGDQVRSHIQTALEELGSEPGDFKDWVDVTKDSLGGDLWAANLSSKVESEFFNSFDNNNDYYKSLDDYVRNAIFNIPNVTIPSGLIPELVEKVSSILRQDAGAGSDLDEMVGIVNNNPLTKLDNAPPDTILPLSTSVSLSDDYRGVPFQTGYLNLIDYFTNVAYPKSNGDSTNLPSTLKDSAMQGYVGYSPYSLEALYNPGLAENMTDFSQSMLPIALSQLDSTKSMLQPDSSVYNISLLALDLAGFTSGAELDMSMMPKYDEKNSDPGGGSLPLSRDKATTF